MRICKQMPMDRIFVKRLVLRALVGKDAWFRSIPQPVNVSFSIQKSLKGPGVRDDIEGSVDYDMISQKIQSILEKNHHSSILNAANSVVSELPPRSIVQLSMPKAVLRAKEIEVELPSNLLTIRGLVVGCIVGLNSVEREHKQNVVVEVELSPIPDDPHSVVESLVQKIEQSSFLTVEALSEFLASFVIRSNIGNKVKVRACKPSALDLAEFAGVEVCRDQANSKYDDFVYIAFGSNVGDSVDVIRNSIHELNKRGIDVVSTSRLYESAPMYYQNQPPFINGVFCCSTDLSPHDLLRALKDVEYKVFGRDVSTERNGPRSLDLDILLYKGQYILENDLIIPHNDLKNRSFVLKPLSDVAPHIQIDGCSVEDHLKELPTSTSDQSSSSLTTLSPLKHGNFAASATDVMAIINATPDSFSDGGKTHSVGILETARRCVAEGATILDVGGLSTRPGSVACSTEEETKRVLEVVESLRKLPEFDRIPISVDTYRSEVASAALAAGADIVNDVFAGMQDPKILDLVASTGVPIIMMHSRGDPSNMKTLTDYPEGVIKGVATELAVRVREAESKGICRWQIFLDPGLGFAKTPQQDAELLSHLSLVSSHEPILSGLPWLVGPSRKSFIGAITNVKDPTERVPGTIAAVTCSVQQGAAIVRVHDVGAAKQATMVADAFWRS